MNDDDLRARLRDLGPRPDEINPNAVDPYEVERRGRQHRRRLSASIGAALVIVAAAIAVPLAVTGPSSPSRVSAVAGPQRGPGATPTALTPTSPNSTTTPPAVDSCPLTQLQVKPGHSGAGLGHVTLTITFTNAGTYPCQLAGYPQVFGVTTAGSKTALRDDSTPAPPVGTAVVLQPGTAVEALLSGLDNPQGQATCPAPYASFLVQLPYQAATTTISAYVPYLAANFPSCVPAQISAFGPPGSFGGLDGVSTTVLGCSPAELRLGVPPGTSLLTHYESGQVQVNLSVTNIGPACTAFGYPSLVFYGGGGGRLNLPVGHGNTDTGDQPPGDVFLQSSQSANFVLEFTPTAGQGPCEHLSALQLDGTSSRLTLDGKTGQTDVCGTVHESAIYPPAY